MIPEPASVLAGQLNLTAVESNVHAAALSLGTPANDGPDGVSSALRDAESLIPPGISRSAPPAAAPCETAPCAEFISASSSFTRAVRSTGVVVCVVVSVLPLVLSVSGLVLDLPQAPSAAAVSTAAIASARMNAVSVRTLEESGPRGRRGRPRNPWSSHEHTRNSAKRQSKGFE